MKKRVNNKTKSGHLPDGVSMSAHSDRGSAIKLGVEPIYDLRKISPIKAIILGLQHMFAMFGATVLVPLLTGLDVSTTLLMAGCGTLIFHLLTRGKVPAFLGSSFAFLGGYAAVAPLQDGWLIRTISLCQWRCGNRGFVYVVLAALIKARRTASHTFSRRLLPGRLSSIGLILAPTAITNCQTDWTHALKILLSSLSVISGPRQIKIIPVMMGIIVAYLFALPGSDLTTVHSEYVFQVPIHTTAFAKFDISAIITILPIS